MRRVVEFKPHAFSPHARCYVAGRFRVHHGALGVVLLTTGMVLSRWPMGSALVGAGAALCAHDYADRRVWMKFSAN